MTFSSVVNAAAQQPDDFMSRLEAEMKRQEQLDAEIHALKQTYSLDTALLGACKRDNPLAAALLLKEGADPNAVDFDASEENEDYHLKTPLGIAALVNNFALVKLLLDNKADPNKWCDDCTPLWLSAQNIVENREGEQTRLKIAQLLLERGADPNKGTWTDGILLYPLIEACMGHNDNEELVDLLLDHGADPFLPVINSRTSDLLFPFHSATPKIFKKLIDHELNKIKQPKPLFGREIGNLSLSIHLENFSRCISYYAFFSNSPLYNFVLQQDKDNVELLLKLGASINPGFRGKTPLDFALEKNDREILDLFKEYPAYMYKKDQNGDFPIENALKARKYKTVEFLVDNGSPIPPSVREELSIFFQLHRDRTRLDLIQRRGKEVPPLELDHIGPFDHLPRVSEKRKAESSSDAAEHVEKKRKLPSGEM